MPVFEFSLSRPVAAARRRRRSHLVSWLVGTMPKVWMHQKLWRKFAIIEVALAFYCAWDGAWESINSVHQTAPGRSSVVNISHHHQFPKQQLPPQEKKSHCKIHIHTRILSYFSSPVLVKWYYYEEKYFQVPCKELELTLKGGTINVMTYL